MDGGNLPKPRRSICIEKKEDWEVRTWKVTFAHGSRKLGWKREMELLYTDDKAGEEPSQANRFPKRVINVMVEAFQNLKWQEVGSHGEASEELAEGSA